MQTLHTLFFSFLSLACSVPMNFVSLNFLIWLQNEGEKKLLTLLLQQTKSVQSQLLLGQAESLKSAMSAYCCQDDCNAILNSGTEQMSTTACKVR